MHGALLQGMAGALQVRDGGQAGQRVQAGARGTRRPLPPPGHVVARPPAAPGTGQPFAKVVVWVKGAWARSSRFSSSSPCSTGTSSTSSACTCLGDGLSGSGTHIEGLLQVQVWLEQQNHAREGTGGGMLRRRRSPPPKPHAALPASSSPAAPLLAWKPSGGAASVAGGGPAAACASCEPGHTQTRPPASTTGRDWTLMPLQKVVEGILVQPPPASKRQPEAGESGRTAMACGTRGWSWPLLPLPLPLQQRLQVPPAPNVHHPLLPPPRLSSVTISCFSHRGTRTPPARPPPGRATAGTRGARTRRARTPRRCSGPGTAPTSARQEEQGTGGRAASSRGSSTFALLCTRRYPRCHAGSTNPGQQLPDASPTYPQLLPLIPTC